MNYNFTSHYGVVFFKMTLEVLEKFMRLMQPGMTYVYEFGCMSMLHKNVGHQDRAVDSLYDVWNETLVLNGMSKACSSQGSPPSLPIYRDIY